MNMPGQNIKTVNQLTDGQNETKNIEIEYIFRPPKEIMEILNPKEPQTYSDIKSSIENDENTEFKIIFSNYFDLLSEKIPEKELDIPDLNEEAILLIKKKKRMK